MENEMKNVVNSLKNVANFPLFIKIIEDHSYILY